MESLTETLWDVVISGTGLPQALLALSLSRSEKKILHVDKNRYYGGDDAAFTLQEAAQWINGVKTGQYKFFSDARITEPISDSESTSPPTALSSRAYSLTLAPQIIYANSRFLKTLVSSQLHTQLEFLAVGSWWTCDNDTLRRIPTSREDIFLDDKLSRREKAALAKLLRYVTQDPETETEAVHDEGSLQAVLSSRFAVTPALQTPILALSLSQRSSDSTAFSDAVSRIRRHVQSIGVFGSGFGAVISKYGGNAEIAQVACRACAVGGGIYILGQGIKAMSRAPEEDASEGQADLHSSGTIELELSNGEKLKAMHVVGSLDDLPSENSVADVSPPLEMEETLHAISVISDPMAHLFPPISDSGPPSAVAIVLVSGGEEAEAGYAPMYLQIHSEETAECPRGQCVVYGSVALENEDSRNRLTAAIETLLRHVSADMTPSIVWSMSYTSKHRGGTAPSGPLHQSYQGKIMVFPPSICESAFDDSVLDNVRTVWETIMGEDADDEEFLRFVERERDDDDDE